MQKESVDSLMRYNIPRMLADGVEYVDLMKIWGNTETIDDWCSKWMDAALEHQKIAEQSLAEGHNTTAGEAFWRASLYNHYGQFMEWHNRAVKDYAVKRKVETYKRAAPLLQPPAERIEIPYESAILPGYLRLPVGNKKAPCVLLIGGLESTKEEYYAFENLCLRRGLATFAFDGPGQGEVYHKIKARPEFEKATSAVVDFLQNRHDVDAERFGVIGRSLGGYYAPRSAAFDTRIKACVAWAAIYDFRTWDKMSAGLKDGWTYISGKKNWNEAREYFNSFTLNGVAERIRCPLYILQGRLDDICPAEQAEWLAKEAKGPTKLVIEEQGTHYAHNMGHIVRPRMTDWLAKTLSA